MTIHQRLKVGKKLEVYVSHSASPGSFWCQLVEREEQLNELMDQLVSITTPTDFTPQPGQLCAAKYMYVETFRPHLVAIHKHCHARNLLVIKGSVLACVITGIPPLFPLIRHRIEVIKPTNSSQRKYFHGC